MFKHRFFNYFKRKKYLNLLSSSKNRKLLVISLILIVLIVSFVIPSRGFKTSINKLLSMAGVYTEEIKQVTLSNGNNPGNFTITKSADWIGENKAQLTINLKTILKSSDKHKDVVLIIDNSSSMSGQKLDKVKEDSKELIELLLSDSNNSVSIISFNSTSEVLSNFSKNENDLKGFIDNLESTGGTNYNAALTNLDTVLSTYTEKENTNLISLFITDGCPGEDTPNEIGTYHILKDKYNFLNLIGIQYEMGNSLKQELVKISDSQYVTDMKSLNNVLIDASINPIKYDSFIIDEYLDTNYFTVSNVSEISTSIGEVTLDNNHITWNLGNLTTGLSQQMNIKIDLVNNLSDGYYPINSSLVVTGSLEDSPINNSYVDTPVLSTNYNVNYISNAPSGCNIESNSVENHRMYSTVSKKTNTLSCEGYLFKDWSVEDNNIKYINDDTFIMPSRDINIRGTWTKNNITVTMDGTVHEKTTLYKVLKTEAENNGLAREYTGEHQDSMDSSKSTQKIYHWFINNNTNAYDSVLNKNNVIFADQCWQMMRTTDTGGVKMIYNGEAEDGQCLSTRNNHVMYYYTSSESITTQNLASNYWYGTSYSYDKDNNLFSISGNTEQVKWSASTGQSLVGKYTCKKTTESGTCSSIYLVEAYSNSTSGKCFVITKRNKYSSIGEIEFNKTSTGLAGSGYLYGNPYATGSYSIENSTYISNPYTIIDNKYLFSLSHWYADSISYDSTTGKYSLVDPYKVSSTDDYSSLVGKYTFRSSNELNQATGVYYIVTKDNDYAVVKKLTEGHMLSYYNTLNIGSSITDNGDDTYTINNPVSISLSDWYTNYANYKKMYTCGDTSTTCSEPRYIITTTSTNYNYLKANEKLMIAKTRNGTTLTDTLVIGYDDMYNNYSTYSDYKYYCGYSSTCTEDNLRMIRFKNETSYTYITNKYFGSDIIWDGTNYTLVDPIGMENYYNSENLSTHHFVCLENGKKVCSSVAYIYYIDDLRYFYYILLSNGEVNINNILSQALDYSTNDSLVKESIDAWYKNYLFDYTDYLEDTIFCNDRSFSSEQGYSFAESGWNPNGGSITNGLYFNGYTDDSLICPREVDKLSVSNINAKLDFPVGLLTKNEIILLGGPFNSSVLYADKWLMTPNYLKSNYISFYVKNSMTGIRNDTHNFGVTTDVQPAISLKPGTEYSSGDGSMANPYIIDTSN